MRIGKAVQGLQGVRAGVLGEGERGGVDARGRKHADYIAAQAYQAARGGEEKGRRAQPAEHLRIGVMLSKAECAAAVTVQGEEAQAGEWTRPEVSGLEAGCEFDCGHRQRGAGVPWARKGALRPPFSPFLQELEGLARPSADV